MDYGEIILELLDRIKKLEKDVEELKKASTVNVTSSGTVAYPDLSSATPTASGASTGVSAVTGAGSAYIGQDNSFFTKDINNQNNGYVGYSYGNRRDTTRYMFKGSVYLKNRLVLAVVKDYIESNPDVTRQQLSTCFNKSLQGSIGVVENVEVACRRVDYNVRFFTREKEVLHLVDGDMYVCNQWGIVNISNFIKKAQLLGYSIEPIQ